MASERIEAISYVPNEYREYVSVNYGRPDPKKTFINKVFNNESNTAVEVVFGYENKSPNLAALLLTAFGNNSGFEPGIKSSDLLRRVLLSGVCVKLIKFK